VVGLPYTFKELTTMREGDRRDSLRRELCNRDGERNAYADAIGTRPVSLPRRATSPESRLAWSPVRRDGCGGIAPAAENVWVSHVSSRSASVNSTGSTCAPEAAALSFTCSGRDAPTIADVTFGCLRNPRKRELGQSKLGVGRQLSHRLHRFKSRRCQPVWI